MMYLKLVSGVGFFIKDSESKAIVEEIYKNGKETVVIQGNLIPAHQIAGIFNENIGREFEAKKRGLVSYRGAPYTKDELIGRPLSITDSYGDSIQEEVKMIESK